MEEHTRPKFLYPIEFMKDEDKYYFDREDFAFIRKGESPQTTTVSVYIKKHANGSIFSDEECLGLIKEQEKFIVQYPPFTELNFEKESILQEDEWILLEEIKNVVFSHENEQEVDNDDVFDLNVFTNYVNELANYIDGVKFFIDKRLVDQKLILLPDLLIKYLDHFQEKEDKESYLEEWRIEKINIEEVMSDGERKNYKMKLYDLIIEVIEREIEEKIKQEKPGEKKQITINKKKNKEERPYLHWCKKDLDDALNEAIESGDKQKAIDLENERSRRNYN